MAEVQKQPELEVRKKCLVVFRHLKLVRRPNNHLSTAVDDGVSKPAAVQEPAAGSVLAVASGEIQAGFPPKP
ncbi:zinc finger CCCH domain-containing protein 53 [Pyrus ussuriensis x Pyrus communis]|uniref:Zinc finger CCCH domain-containing protein 53 n=1 Tax=Pyrus ussuriensis x Pyrus communis TaxID=2448454 RepID=A0A5N5H6A0_9ROSA|nr:zinc finger CCCH domain-containing protein 53 [Pyrus ussuriensis x Pyrus communis]